MPPAELLVVGSAGVRETVRNRERERERAHLRQGRSDPAGEEVDGGGARVGPRLAPNRTCSPHPLQPHAAAAGGDRSRAPDKAAATGPAAAGSRGGAGQE